ncbi:MAG TPA: cyclic nucleotide-binding domain-containing protein [Anaeromyxobacteraceae bacterium]|nr:cyclic nucleotide-binding domain-containing protein [Anaeromyxobacteraceae bacterium]
MKNVEVLQRCPLFKDFTEVGLRIFAEIGVPKVVPAGSPLFVENMVGEALFIVKSGAVRVTQRGASGDRELAILGPGEALGGLAMLAKGVRLVSAVAVTPLEVLEITHRDYFRKIPEKPQACLKLALAIAADLAARAADSREALREVHAKKTAG